MNTSLSWIKAYVPDLDVTAQEYTDAMTLSGTKVEGYEVLDADLEEERRMFYVAMTRAKDRLHIFYVNERFHKKQTVSRFVEETGLLDTDSETRREAEKERNQKRGFEWKIKMREPV